MIILDFPVRYWIRGTDRPKQLWTPFSKHKDLPLTLDMLSTTFDPARFNDRFKENNIYSPLGKTGTWVEGRFVSVCFSPVWSDDNWAGLKETVAALPEDRHFNSDRFAREAYRRRLISGKLHEKDIDFSGTFRGLTNHPVGDFIYETHDTDVVHVVSI